MALIWNGSTTPSQTWGCSATGDYEAIVESIRTARDQGGVYIHCWGGIGRTGTVAGCLLVDSGMSADEALGRITELRSVTKKSNMAAPQTHEQIEVIRQRSRTY
ncbi:MAG: protein-tyrosine phosphatase family protein [Microthrixaceae bacterium]